MLYVSPSESCISGFWLWGVAGVRVAGAKEKSQAMSILRTAIKKNIEGFGDMSKRELIDCICEINKTAKPEFLAGFAEDELKNYLEHLMELDLEELLVCA
jgi:hypothetical protein